jgi:hypothetical protein
LSSRHPSLCHKERKLWLQCNPKLRKIVMERNTSLLTPIAANFEVSSNPVMWGPHFFQGQLREWLVIVEGRKQLPGTTQAKTWKI